MYRCVVCARVVEPRTPAVRVVLTTRTRTYPQRLKANVLYRTTHRGKRRRITIDDPGGRGTEVVTEAFACPRCASDE